MGINIHSLETLASKASKYAENCGVKSILQTKKVPINVAYLPSLKLQSLKSDCLHIGEKAYQNIAKFNEVKFSPLEQNLMDSIRGLKLENMHIIDKDGNLDKSIKFLNYESGCSFAPGQSMEEIDKILKDATIIHNHPNKLSLSCNDFYTLAAKRSKRMIATTPEGGYSILERNCDWNEQKHNDFLMACQRLVNEEFSKVAKLKATRCIRNADRTNILNDWRYQRFGSVANDFGLTFINKVDKTTGLDIVPRGTFVNFFQNFTDSIVFYAGMPFRK